MRHTAKRERRCGNTALTRRRVPGDSKSLAAPPRSVKSTSTSRRDASPAWMAGKPHTVRGGGRPPLCAVASAPCPTPGRAADALHRPSRPPWTQTGGSRAGSPWPQPVSPGRPAPHGSKAVAMRAAGGPAQPYGTPVSLGRTARVKRPQQMPPASVPCCGRAQASCLANAPLTCQRPLGSGHGLWHGKNGCAHSAIPSERRSPWRCLHAIPSCQPCHHRPPSASYQPIPPSGSPAPRPAPRAGTVAAPPAVPAVASGALPPPLGLGHGAPRSPRPGAP
jgi:hypothetical protein